MKAIWKRQTIAESNDTLVVENKGKAHYYTLVVNGEQNPDAAWYYPKPKPAAKEIKDYVAFWRGVEISE